MGCALGSRLGACDWFWPSSRLLRRSASRLVRGLSLRLNFDLTLKLHSLNATVFGCPQVQTGSSRCHCNSCSLFCGLTLSHHCTGLPISQILLGIIGCALAAEVPRNPHRGRRTLPSNDVQNLSNPGSARACSSNNLPVRSQSISEPHRRHPQITVDQYCAIYRSLIQAPMRGFGQLIPAATSGSCVLYREPTVSR